jgi:hypothetical protein
MAPSAGRPRCASAALGEQVGHGAEIPLERGSQREKDAKRLKELGLPWDQWQNHGTWTGLAFPTPCSDGRHVYTVTGHYLYSCHDLDGKLVWQQRLAESADERTKLSAEQAARLDSFAGTPGAGKWPHGWPGQGTTSTSPALADGVLVSEVGSWTRGIDTATGAVRWQHPNPVEIHQVMANPRIIDLHGTAVMLTATSAEAIRLHDGRILGRLPVGVHCKSFASGPAVNGDIVLGVAKSDAYHATAVAAFRLGIEGDTLRCTELWRKPVKQAGINLWRTMAWRDRFVSEWTSVAAADGGEPRSLTPPKDAAGKQIRMNTTKDAIIVGDRLIVKNYETGAFAIADLASGRVLGTAQLPLDPDTGRSMAWKQAQEHGSRWRALGCAAIFPAHGRLYLRSYDYLWCIGAR